MDDPEIECCEYVQIKSTGALRYYHRNAMGNYTSQRQKNNRIVYKHEDQQLFLHYNDFGVLEVKKINNFRGFNLVQFFFLEQIYRKWK